MNPDDIRATVARALRRIAPEADPESLAPDDALRGELDLDSMDFLNFVAALHRLTGVAVPEADYAQIDSLAGCLRYFSAAARPGEPVVRHEPRTTD